MKRGFEIYTTSIGSAVASQVFVVVTVADDAGRREGLVAKLLPSGCGKEEPWLPQKLVALAVHTQRSGFRPSVQGGGEDGTTTTTGWCC